MGKVGCGARVLSVLSLCLLWMCFNLVSGGTGGIKQFDAISSEKLVNTRGGKAVNLISSHFGNGVISLPVGHHWPLFYKFPAPDRHPYFPPPDYNIRNRELMSLSSCTSPFYLYSSIQDINFLDSDHKYCTSAINCLISGVNEKTSISSSIMKFMATASTSFHPTCLYVGDGNKVKRGICCQSRKLQTNDTFLDIFEKVKETETQYKAANPESPSLMDRGHVFSRPGDPPPSEHKNEVVSRLKGDSFIKSESDFDDDDEYIRVNHWHPTHPPLPTHNPEITNKPWWVRSTQSQGTTTTPKPSWTTKSTTKYVPRWQTQRPTTTPTTRYTTSAGNWWDRRSTSKSWYPTWDHFNPWNRFGSTTTTPPTTTTTTTATYPVINARGYCTPSYFRDASQEPSITSEVDINEEKQFKITGGSPFTPHSFPWIAVLFLGQKHICGGSLITENHILTAAHCVASLNGWEMSKLRVTLGMHNLHSRESSRQDHTVKTVIRHKDYSRSLLYNDLAILSLSKPVKITDKVRPICLYSGSDKFVNTNGIVAGWGSLYEGGQQLDTPRKVALTIMDNDECRRLYGAAAPGGIVPFYMCAGIQGKDACSGDSGGPMVKRIGGVWQQIGIVSWGIGCGKGHYPGVYSRISSFMPWIEKVTAKY